MLFISTKTFKMLDVKYLSNISKDVELITKELFSLNILEIFLEYLICSFLIFFILKDKENLFVKKKAYKKRLFLEQVFIAIVTIGLAFIAFLLIKIVFINLKKHMYGDYQYIKRLITFVFLHFNLCLLSSCIVYFFNMIVKDRLESIILPVMLIQIPFILFGLTTLVINSILFPLKKIGEFINLIFLDKLILGFSMGNRLELLSFLKQWMIIILIILLSISFMLMSYGFFIKLKKSNLDKSYYFKGFKIFCHLNLSIIFSYLTSIILSFIIMFFNLSKGMDFASFIFSLSYLILIPIYYIIQYFIYRKFNDIIIK